MLCGEFRQHQRITAQIRMFDYFVALIVMAEHQYLVAERAFCRRRAVK